MISIDALNGTVLSRARTILQGQAHKLSSYFPMLAEPELAALASDIKANGLRVPILTYEGKILDGRNRFKACEEAGVEPRFEPFTGDTGGGRFIELETAASDAEPGGGGSGGCFAGVGEKGEGTATQTR